MLNREIVNLPSCVESVNALSVFDKLRIYIRYYAKMVKNKNSVYIEDKLNPSIRYSRIKPTKIFLGIAFYELWSDFRILSFDEFISTENVKIKDNGNNWINHGWAQRYDVRLYGIYHWYEFFKAELKK